jgi:flagellar motility protein MotE (MotC chaperone)
MKLNRNRLAWTFALITFLTGVSVTLLGASTVQSAQDDTAKAADSATAPAVDAKVPAPEAAAPKKEAATTLSANACLSDPVVLDELNKKRLEMEARQKDLQSKEAELKARETAINDELKKLQDMRDEIAKLDDSHRQANQEKVGKVVETLSSMSPKASAQFLTTLDDALAVAAISQMDTVKLAKIMNTIDPKRGAKLTELLAGVVRAQTVTTSPAQTVSSAQVALKKGGNANDTGNKPESIISGGPDLSAKADQQ